MTRYAVWAPGKQTVAVEVAGTRFPMRHGSRPGWWETDVADTAVADPDAVADYAFVLDGEGPFPDPRSPRQPHGVHGASRPVDHADFAWSDDGWRGVPLAGSVVYELHIGTFTPEGTFDAAANRLDHLVELGIDVIEVMPVAAFDGPHGWGYDGAALFAVHEPYGGPAGFKRFVEACHARGLGVVLDVVYNHLGPSGNYLARFGPYFTDTHWTPWGSAVNLDDRGSDEVRRFLVDNALMWLRDYHVDGLRLDAVHALRDDRAVTFLEELADEVQALSVAVGRTLFLVAESDRNDPRIVTAKEAGGLGLDAQWSDDFHHALHCLLTGERQGYYADFGSLPCLAKTLTRVFFHDGTWSSFRGRHHGRPVDTHRIPAFRFLGYLQDHDQIGNRAIGDRISASASPGLLRIGAALVLTSPFTPMLFMGEEWAASTPWQFFTSFPDPELARSVRDGRRREFAEHGWHTEDVPDPQDPATFERSKLDWVEVDKEPHAAMLRWYNALLALRRSRPELTDPRLDRVAVTYDDKRRWLVVTRGILRVVVNVAAVRQVVPVDGRPDQLLLASSERAADMPADAADRAPLLADGLVELDGESVAIVALVPGVAGRGRAA
jgi:maltooligosyltrehalose trehalohydrolase